MARLKQILARPDLGYFGVGLYDCKNGYNVGGVIRATAGFDGRFVVVQGERWKDKGNWKNMDTEGGYLRIPCFLGVQDIYQHKPEACVPVAIELTDSAIPLPEFEHPKVAMYIFGPEDGALPDGLLANCEHRVYIPSNYSLNLYSAVTAVAYDRVAKQHGVKLDGCPCCGHVNFRQIEGATLGTFHCNACGKEWVRV